MTVAEIRQFYASLNAGREFQEQVQQLRRMVGRTSRAEAERLTRAIHALDGRTTRPAPTTDDVLLHPDDVTVVLAQNGHVLGYRVASTLLVGRPKGGK